MRSSLPLILPLVALSACGPSEPSEGDVYENLLTGERIEIHDVGHCRMIARVHDSIYWDLGHEMGQADPGNAGTIRALNELLGVLVLRADTTHRNNRCYAYFSRTRVEGAGLIKLYNIAPLYELGESRMRRLN